MRKTPGKGSGGPKQPRQTETALNALSDRLRDFAQERDWDQFHTPKNLAMALSVEAAELLEKFQWLTAAQSTKLNRRAKRAVEEEMADVLLYLVRLADVLDTDLLASAERKLQLNARKYPISKSRGNARKYDQL